MYAVACGSVAPTVAAGGAAAGKLGAAGAGMAAGTIRQVPRFITRVVLAGVFRTAFANRTGDTDSIQQAQFERAQR